MKCAECGREGELVTLDENGYEWQHNDGRVKHPFVAQQEENMAPRTRVVSPTGDEEYIPVLQADDPEDASLLQQAEAIFEDDMEDGEVWTDNAPIEPEEEVVTQVVTGEEINIVEADAATSAPNNPNFGRPTKGKMVTVRGGGLYLKARDRISWMRGEPQPRPDWTIDTYPEEIERGKYVSNSKVEGGYARYRANLFDEAGRLIATGTKTEWSERFMDFAEKAETGAIARALAVAGYGTEAALDLDEGYEQDRVADAPVQAASRPINITASSVGGLVQGGRSENITGAQINEIQRLVKVSSMGMSIVPFMENVLDTKVPAFSDENAAQTITEFLEGLTFGDASKLIQALNKVVNDA